MTKRLVDIDDKLLDEAKLLTSAATMKEAVNAALEQLIDTELKTSSSTGDWQRH